MHLAQFNIAEAVSNSDDPIMADFFNNTERINALADAAPGFIWRLKDDASGDSYSIKAYDNEFMLINLSVWEDRQSLFNFVYNTDHVEIFKRRKEWFHKMPKMHMVLWYVEKGHIPTVEEAKERLNYLQQHGESKNAFSFRSKF
ncbi:MAG: DUF3291 domain-containing protein [Flavobacteriaceae bacterium]|nr:DUF3291 domain-containing protein [Flavobacteriaceae bacterium]